MPLELTDWDQQHLTLLRISASLAKMASAYQDQDLDKQQSEGNALEMIESIKELIQAIEVEVCVQLVESLYIEWLTVSSQNGRSRILYGRMLKVLSTEGRIILNIVREEYSAAPATQKTRMLCRLEERFEKLHQCATFLTIYQMLTD